MKNLLKRKIKNFKFEFFILIFFSLLIIITSGRGADFGEYSMWTKYFTEFDLSLWDEYSKSINGKPLIQWQYGVGLIGAMINKLFGIEIFIKKFFDPFHHISIRASIISSVLSLINFSLLIFILRRNLKDNKFFLLIFFSFFLFTPAGYYFNKFSTESLSILLILISLTISEINQEKFKNSHYIAPVMIGIINYFLILVKATNIFTCLCLVVIFLLSIPKKKMIFSSNYKYILKTLFILAIIPFIAVVMMSVYHLIINGNILLSPYNITDNSFSSLDFKNLKTFEILFSPLHGMIFYHPVLLFSFFYLFKKILFNKEFFNTKNLISLSVIFAFFGQLLMQSAFFVWWEGTGTFGSRTFSGISVLIFYSLLKLKKEIKLISLNNSFIFLVILVTIYQSYMLGLGETSFKNLNSFLSNKQDLFDRNSVQKDNITLFFSIFFIIFLSLYLKISLKMNKLFFLICALVLTTITAYLALLLFQYNNRPYLLPLIFLISFIITKYHKNIFSIITYYIKRLPNFISLYLLFLVFVISIFFQLTFFSQLKSVKLNDNIKGKSFSCNDWAASYNEYLQIPGYNYEKFVFLNFLEKNKCELIK